MNDAIEEPSRFSRIYARTVAGFQFIIIGPIAIASTVVSLFSCFCCISIHFAQASDSPKSLKNRLKTLLADMFSGWCIFYTYFFALLFMVALSLCVFPGCILYALLRYDLAHAHNFILFFALNFLFYFFCSDLSEACELLIILCIVVIAVSAIYRYQQKSCSRFYSSNFYFPHYMMLFDSIPFIVSVTTLLFQVKFSLLFRTLPA
jgi:hypothetical protein